MPQQVRRRKQTSIAYSSNNKVSEDLGRGMVYREVYLNLAVTPTLTAGNNVYANILAGDEWACVKRIDIVANGTDVIRSISGNALRWYNFFLMGNFPRNSVLLGAGGANPVCNSTLVLPFWMPRAIRPMDTALDSRELSDLTIEVTWGTHTDIAASATGFTTNPTIEVYSLESFNVSGSFSQSRVFTIEETITASNTQHKVRLPVGSMYRGFLINTTDAAADDGDVINNLKLISGTTVFADLSEEVLVDVELARNGSKRSFSGVAYDDLAIGDANSIDGWYFLDVLSDGFMSEAIDTLGFSEFELEFDLTVGGGTTKLFIYPLQVIPVRGGA